MENIFVLKMDTASKILFSLFNFFAPISLIAICLSQSQSIGFLGTLISLAGIAAALFVLIRGLKNYNTYLTVSDGKMYLCKGKGQKTKTLKCISISDLDEKGLELLRTKLSVIDENGKETQLLNYKPSLLGLICYIGPFVILPVLKQNLIYENLYSKLETVLPQNDNKKTKTGMFFKVIINLIVWGFVLFISFVGFLGLFLTPFYPFLG